MLLVKVILLTSHVGGEDTDGGVSAAGSASLMVLVTPACLS